MDWLQALTPKRLAIALGVCAVLRLGLPYWRYPVSWYLRRLYPPQGGASEAGQDILAEVERREAGRVEARYRRVLAELEQARADGFDTRALESKARAALTLNVAAYRRSAVRMLTEVEMAVPRKKVQYIPMGATQAPGEEIEPDVKPKAVEEKPAPKAKKSRRRAR